MEEIAIIDQLEMLRIKPEDQIPSHEFLFRWNGTPCFARGELVAVGGKAKSGKTYLCSTLLSLCSRQQLLSLTRDGEAPLRAVWIDTEQSEDTTHEILTTRVADPSLVKVYNLRRKPWRERLDLAYAAILLNKGVDLIIFDGIRDVVGDINDYTMAQDVVDKMLSLASFTGACIVCVLHQNKSAEDKTLRGALGTELMNKCFESYECKKDEETLIFSVSQQATRKYDVRGKLNFIIDENGLPKQCQTVESVTKETRSYNPYHFNEKYLLPGGKGQLNLRALMQFAFGDQKPLRLAPIIEIVRHEANVQSYSLAEKIVRNAVGEHLIENIPTLGLDIFRLATPDLFTHQQGPQ